ncbi:MAG TPA: outer membrane beta-barrel protein, partial [Bacteroidota bacterium]|nr:outer membrane beta-barrel protein [Bacteroidota bacterium]
PLGNGLTADVGKFVTHMGYEVIESKDNWNYSRSLLFAWAVPYYHTGLRLTYPCADNFTVAVHVVDGWNSTIDNNAEQSLGLSLSYSPTGSTGLILNVIDGFEQPSGADVGKKKVFDFIVTDNVSEALALSLNADYGDEATVSGLYTWKGAAAYGRYACTPHSAVAVRAEVFDDPRGYATGLGVPGLRVYELTATYEYRFADALLLRGEVRHDNANAPIFDRKADVNALNGQTTFLVGVVAMF